MPLTLDGNGDISGLVAGALPANVIGAGAVLQVVSTAKTDTFSESVATGATSGDVTGLTASITPSSTSSNVLYGASDSWLKRNIYQIKGILITVILILMIYVAIKIAKVIVQNDLLNSFILRQLKKKQHSQYEEQQQAAAAQQAQEYGEAPAATNINVNNE